MSDSLSLRIIQSGRIYQLHLELCSLTALLFCSASVSAPPSYCVACLDGTLGFAWSGRPQPHRLTPSAIYAWTKLLLREHDFSGSSLHTSRHDREPPPCRMFGHHAACVATLVRRRDATLVAGPSASGDLHSEPFDTASPAIVRSGAHSARALTCGLLDAESPSWSLCRKSLVTEHDPSGS